MTDQTQTPAATVETPLTWEAFVNGAKLVAEFGGRKRKGDKPAFAKITRGVEWAAIPDESKLYLVDYGFKQYLADGANTADSDAEFAAAIDDRLGKVMTADFARSGGDGPTPTNDPETLANTLARQEVVAAISAKPESKAAWGGLTKEQKAQTVTAYRAQHAIRLVAEATRQIESRKAGAATLDLNALLGLTPST